MVCSRSVCSSYSASNPPAILASSWSCAASTCFSASTRNSFTWLCTSSMYTSNYIAMFPSRNTSCDI